MQLEYTAGADCLERVGHNRTDNSYWHLHGDPQREELAVADSEEGAFLFRNPDKFAIYSRMRVVACPLARYPATACLALQPGVSTPGASFDDCYRILEQASPLFT